MTRAASGGRGALRTVGIFTLGFALAALAMGGGQGGGQQLSAREEAERKDAGTNSAAGKDAAAPTGIEARGWREILVRTFGEISRDRVLAVAAGVTFYGLLAIFPAIAAFVSLYGLVAQPDTIMEHLGFLATILPAGAYELVRDHVLRLSATGSGQLGLSLAISLALSIWSANAGMKAIFDALNVAYGEDEKRGFIRLNLLSLGFTAGVLLFAALAVTVIVAAPIALERLYLGRFVEPLIWIGRWPAIIIVLVAALTLLYRFGPSRSQAKWRWVSPGALVAATVWIVASMAFSWYVANFEDYDKTYGALGAVIALTMWMWLSAIIILVGSELNAETERQTYVDTTTGAPMPMGLRGADAADRKH